MRGISFRGISASKGRKSQPMNPNADNRMAIEK